MESNTTICGCGRVLIPWLDASGKKIGVTHENIEDEEHHSDYFSSLTAKPSPVIEIGEEAQAYRNAIVNLNSRLDEMWNHAGISKAIPDSYIKAINKEQQNCLKVLNDYDASHNDKNQDNA